MNSELRSGSHFVASGVTTGLGILLIKDYKRIQWGKDWVY